MKVGSKMLRRGRMSNSSTEFGYPCGRSEVLAPGGFDPHSDKSILNQERTGRPHRLPGRTHRLRGWTHRLRGWTHLEASPTPGPWRLHR